MTKNLSEMSYKKHAENYRNRTLCSYKTETILFNRSATTSETTDALSAQRKDVKRHYLLKRLREALGDRTTMRKQVCAEIHRLVQNSMKYPVLQRGHTKRSLGNIWKTFM